MAPSHTHAHICARTHTHTHTHTDTHTHTHTHNINDRNINCGCNVNTTDAADRARLVAGSTTRRTRGVLTTLAGRGPERATAFVGPLSQQRRVVTVDTLLADHRLVRQTHGGTVNDVVLAMCTAGLRRYLSDHDTLPDRALVASVPVPTASVPSPRCPTTLAVIVPSRMPNAVT